MQLQVLEPDYIDTSKDGIKGSAGGNIIQGVEFDAIGRRVAYWLFDQHPGGGREHARSRSASPPTESSTCSIRSAPGQVRGPSWFASVDVRLHEFDEFEDATLMKQKIAACLAAFVTTQTAKAALARTSRQHAAGRRSTRFEPGMIVNLPPGKDVKIANPPDGERPPVVQRDQLRGSPPASASRTRTSPATTRRATTAPLAWDATAHGRRPRLALEHAHPAVLRAGVGVDARRADPRRRAGRGRAGRRGRRRRCRCSTRTRTASATTKAVRAGQMTHDEMVREQGYDPDAFWKEYAAGLKRLDKYGIVLDSDPRKTSGRAARCRCDAVAGPRSPRQRRCDIERAAPADASRRICRCLTASQRS
jgi:hypothetical protein